MKKGQIEIIGLAVIIIILAVSLIIALFFILKPKINVLEDQRQSIRASSLLNTLIETNTNLTDKNNKTTIKDLLIACYPNQQNCEKNIKEPILNKIFNNTEYILIIKQDPGGPIKIPNKDDCQNPRADKINTDPIVIQATPRMTISLTLCSPER